MKFFLLPRTFVAGLIWVYQKTISPDHGPLQKFFPYGYCKYQPSCSQYGYEAVKKYGVVMGGVRAVWRILRCNPFSRGGADPLT